MLHDYYETIVQTEEVCTIYAHSPAYRLIINIDFIETTYVKGTETASPPYQATQSIDLSKLDMEDYIKARKNK